jgi:hypothetical protein
VPAQALRVFISHNWQAHHGYYVAVVGQLMRSTVYNVIDLSVSKEVMLRRKTKDVQAIVKRRIARTDLFILIRDRGEELSPWVRREIRIASALNVCILEAQTACDTVPIDEPFWKTIGVIDLEIEEIDVFLFKYSLSDEFVERPLTRAAHTLFGGHRRKLSKDGRLTYRHYKRPRPPPR